MNYSELIQLYFERSVALQWYWTIYVLVIGGLLGFSTFRQRPERVTTMLVAILFGCFAYKNLGAIEATAEERQAVLATLREYPALATNAGSDIKRLRDKLEPMMPDYDVAAARSFHVVCDLLTLAFVFAKEARRRRPEPAAPTV